MKRTPLYDAHIKHNASIVNFNGWEMPIQYEGIIAEHNAVRQSVGIFDICHMGVIEITGKDALFFCQYIITNDVSKISDGKAIYSPVCNERGGTVDDVLLYRYNTEKFRFVVNAANIEKDYDWLSLQKGDYKVEIKNLSANLGILAVQGPNTMPLFDSLFGRAVQSLPYYGFVDIDIDNQPVQISRTGYTGEVGFELYFKREHARTYWDLLYDKGKKYGIKPIGLGARDTLRLEMAYSLYGHELTDNISPLQAGLAWTIAFNKDTFIGKEALLKEKEAGVTQKLIAFKMTDRSIPRAGNAIKNMGKKIGFVSSGTFSPSLRIGIGLGYVDSHYAVRNSQITIEARGRDSIAKIVKPPFYEKKVKQRRKD
ncbi:MAG: glycine cleavage system aminomethyltransferase GcvT [Candidatus Ancaeobacter aquaticus]|nr:glycine cleavage system aminomethyltransferase GcvT [Candidatus Ancaeobacter aquaticus]